MANLGRGYCTILPSRAVPLTVGTNVPLGDALNIQDATVDRVLVSFVNRSLTGSVLLRAVGTQATSQGGIWGGAGPGERYSFPVPIAVDRLNQLELVYSGGPATTLDLHAAALRQDYDLALNIEDFAPFGTPDTGSTGGGGGVSTLFWVDPVVGTGAGNGSITDPFRTLDEANAATSGQGLFGRAFVLSPSFQYQIDTPVLALTESLNLITLGVTFLGDIQCDTTNQEVEVGLFTAVSLNQFSVLSLICTGANGNNVRLRVRGSGVRLVNGIDAQALTNGGACEIYAEGLLVTGQVQSDPAAPNVQLRQCWHSSFTANCEFSVISDIRDSTFAGNVQANLTIPNEGFQPGLHNTDIQGSFTTYGAGDLTVNVDRYSMHRLLENGALTGAPGSRVVPTVRPVGQPLLHGAPDIGDLAETVFLIPGSTAPGTVAGADSLYGWVAPRRGFMSNFRVLHNIPNGAAGQDVVYEWRINGIPVVALTLNSDSALAADDLTQQIVNAGDIISVSATKAIDLPGPRFGNIGPMTSVCFD